MSIPTEHPFPFDPTGGMTLDQLRAIDPPEGVEGFENFWAARYDRALSVDPQPSRRAGASNHPEWQVEDISYTSTEGLRIGGWLLRPKTGAIRRGLVVGHGYGGRDAPDYDIPVEETAVLFPCFRGLSRSAHAPFYSDPAWHVLHDIDKPDRYVLGGCVEDLWLAVSALIRLFPEVEGRVGYSGISFGGGIGALAMASDDRIDRGHLTVPTFGNMALWSSLPTVGSAAAVQAYQARHGSVMATLRLFDSAVAARRIRVPMLVAPALFDPVVAPPCQFSVANALPPSNLHETFVLDAGHVDYPGMSEQHERLRERVGRFFRVA